jgi:hypothetical protein
MESIKERIERRAYELFLKRNGAHGYHMEDWIQAEKEIAAEIAAEKKIEKRSPATTMAASPKVDPVKAERTAPAMSVASTASTEKQKPTVGKIVRKTLKKRK